MCAITVDKRHKKVFYLPPPVINLQPTLILKLIFLRMFMGNINWIAKKNCGRSPFKFTFDKFDLFIACLEYRVR